MTSPPGPPAPGPLRDHQHQHQLTSAYPAFAITRQHYTWRKPRWEAVRKNPREPGLYAAITPDVDELRAVLAATITTTTRPGPQERPPEPGPPFRPAESETSP
jgi:hypothetical protein